MHRRNRFLVSVPYRYNIFFHKTVVNNIFTVSDMNHSLTPASAITLTQNLIDRSSFFLSIYYNVYMARDNLSV
jgi:hypothetical protein